MIEKTLELIRGHPQQFLLEASLSSAISMLAGCNYATHSALLIGFKEWLVVRRGSGVSIVWMQLLQDVVLEELPHADERLRFEKAISLVIDFLQERARHDGARNIFLRFTNLTAASQAHR
jgi:hypothetical protein